MERVGTLINKLQEQFQQHADASTLLITTQLLLAELQQQTPAANTGRKVAVILPGNAHAAAPTVVTEQPTPVPPVEPAKPVVEVKEPAQSSTPQSPVEPIQPSSPVEPAKKPAEPVKPAQNGWLFDTVASVPTLAHQEPKKEVFELNDSMTAADESLNEKLKEQRVEVASVLQGSPVRDLKKAIGINDRYLYINELFRGDEDMYERSIKTINAFNIYPEAEYWIQRELKVKLGWNEGTEAVKSFDQLVKRRFS